jgi:hypothetical protein
MQMRRIGIEKGEGLGGIAYAARQQQLGNGLGKMRFTGQIFGPESPSAGAAT